MNVTVTMIEEQALSNGPVALDSVTSGSPDSSDDFHSCESQPDNDAGKENNNEDINGNSTGPVDRDHPQYTGSRFDIQKPPYSYASLIAEAILHAPSQRLTLSEVYASIMNTYPYYRSRNSGWQNSIRHNLSLNKCFTRVERTDGERGKGSWWTVDPDLLDFVDGSRAVPKTGSMARKKKTRVRSSVVQVNKLENNFGLDSLFMDFSSFESNRVQSPEENVQELCSALQEIHSCDFQHLLHIDW